MSKIPNLKRQAIERRTNARRLLLQTLYQWQICNDSPEECFGNRIIDTRTGDIDEEYLVSAFETITSERESLESKYTPFMDRAPSSLDAVERAVLWIGAYEVLYRPDIHSTVSINEAVELAKQFGGSESYAFINAVLDQLSKASNNKVLP